MMSYKLLDGKSLRALYLGASGKLLRGLQGCVKSTIVLEGWLSRVKGWIFDEAVLGP